MTTILVANDKILVTLNTRDYKPYNCLEQVAKDNQSQKKLHMACIVTFVVAYHPYYKDVSSID
jgi:hypothetical protein